jgi:hypothetical protein
VLIRLFMAYVRSILIKIIELSLNFHEFLIFLFFLYENGIEFVLCTSIIPEFYWIILCSMNK